MANYTDDRDKLAQVLDGVLSSPKVQEQLARNVAMQFGYMLEPMIKNLVKEHLSKLEVVLKSGHNR